MTVLHGCADTAAPSDSVVVLDSAGVTIRTTLKPAWADTPSIALDVPPQFAGLPRRDDLALTDVVAAQITPLGRLAIIDAGERLYSIDGRSGAVASVANRGEGPGELRAAASVDVRDDGTLEVYDKRIGRVTQWTQDGDLLSTAQIPLEMLEYPPQQAWRLANGRILTWESSIRRASVIRRSGNAEVLALSTMVRQLKPAEDEHHLDTLFMTLAGEVVREGGVWWEAPFGPVADATAKDSTIYISHGDRYEVRVLRVGTEETTLEVLRYPGANRGVEAGELTFLRDSIRALTRLAGVPFRNAAAFDSDLQPQLRPSFRKLVVDGLGRIWAQQFEPLRQPSPLWWVILPSGQFGGVVRLPGGTELISADSSLMVLEVRDEYDVPAVLVARLPEFAG